MTRTIILCLFLLIATSLFAQNNDDVKKDFTHIDIALKPGDMIYLFSDGYADQFGDEHGKKFKQRQLEEKLLALSSLSCTDQQQDLAKTFEHWKGQLEQVDDVCIIGIRI